MCFYITDIHVAAVSFVGIIIRVVVAVVAAAIANARSHDIRRRRCLYTYICDDEVYYKKK